MDDVFIEVTCTRSVICGWPGTVGRRPGIFAGDDWLGHDRSCPGRFIIRAVKRDEEPSAVNQLEMLARLLTASAWSEDAPAAITFGSPAAAVRTGDAITQVIRQNRSLETKVAEQEAAIAALRAIIDARGSESPLPGGNGAEDAGREKTDG